MPYQNYGQSVIQPKSTYKGYGGNQSVQSPTAVMNYVSPAAKSVVQSQSAPKINTPSSGGSSSGGGSSSADLLKAAIEAERNAAQDSIGKLRSSVQGQESGLIDAASKTFDSQVPLINQARDQGVGYLNQASSNAQMAGENALTSARGLYNELDSRNRQLFGGAQNSSVGGAASELLGREQMRQTGNIRQGVTDQVSNFALNIQNLRDKASAQLQQIELQKQAAIADVKNRVADALRQIDQLEFQTGQDYSQAKLDAIKDYANSLRSNNQYATQLTQQVNQQLQGYDQTLGDIYNTYNAESQSAISGADNGLNRLDSTFGEGMNSFAMNNSIGSGGNSAYNPYTGFSGNVGQQRRPKDDRLGQLEQAGFIGSAA